MGSRTFLLFFFNFFFAVYWRNMDNFHKWVASLQGEILFNPGWVETSTVVAPSMGKKCRAKLRKTTKKRRRRPKKAGKCTQAKKVKRSRKTAKKSAPKTKKICSKKVSKKTAAKKLSPCEKDALKQRRGGRRPCRGDTTSRASATPRRGSSTTPRCRTA